MVQWKPIFTEVFLYPIKVATSYYEGHTESPVQLSSPYLGHYLAQCPAGDYPWDVDKVIAKTSTETTEPAEQRILARDSKVLRH